MPLREVVVDLHDSLKSASAGYASLSYDILNWRPTDLIKLSILVADEPVEPLAVIVRVSKRSVRVEELLIS